MTLHYCDRCKKQIKFLSSDGKTFAYQKRLVVTAEVKIYEPRGIALCLRCLTDIIEDGQPLEPLQEAAQ